MSLRSFLKRNWIGVIGILIGIASLSSSFYFYKISTEPPEPIFLLDPSRTIIIESDRFPETPLRVTRSNGNEIKGDVTSVRLYFWNNGRKSIRPSNILEPLVITLGDTNGEILDYKIIKSSRKVVEPILERYSIDPDRSLILSFSILEKGDGLTCQLIYEGERDADLTISGTIENVSGIVTNQKMIRRRFWSEYGKLLGSIIAALGVVIIVVSVTDYLEKHKLKSGIAKILFLIIRYSIFAIAIMFFIYAIVWRPVRKALEEASTTIIQTVPKEIIP